MVDWHTRLTSETREANVKKIVEHLDQFIPPEGVQSAILKFSRNFEEDCWKKASSLHDYDRKIKEEMARIEKYEQLCEDNPFTDRKYEGFLGAIKMTFTSKTVAAPPGQIQKDPDDITLEQSARTVLRRNTTLKETVRRLLLEKAVKKGKGNAGSALLNAMKAAQLQKQRQAGEEQQTSTKGTEPESSPDATQQAHALSLFQKKNKNPGLLARK